MWFECDAEETRESRHRSFEERKRNSKVPAKSVELRCTSIGNGDWALRAFEIPSVAGIGPGATRLGEELAPVFSFAASDDRSRETLSAQTRGPSRLCRNATEFPPVDKTNHAGRAPSTNPKLPTFLRTLCARPALPLRFSGRGITALKRAYFENRTSACCVPRCTPSVQLAPSASADSSSFASRIWRPFTSEMMSPGRKPMRAAGPAGFSS